MRLLLAVLTSSLTSLGCSQDEAAVTTDAAVVETTLPDTTPADTSTTDTLMTNDTTPASETLDAPADACANVCTCDIGSEEMAKTICAMSKPCKVCVQSFDDAGKPTKWMALMSPESCPCPPPM